MEEKIVKVRELEKKITGFQEIPRGSVDVAYVFFQSKDNSRYTITTEKKKIMSAELRIGKYDRIMEIKRGKFEERIYKKISCKENGHYFTADLNVECYVKNPEYIYLNQTYEISAELKRCFSGMEIDLGETYGYHEQAALEKDLKMLVEDRLSTLSYLSCSVLFNVKVDDDAQELLDMERRHEISKNQMDITAIEEQMKAENQFEAERSRLEYEKVIAREKAEVQQIQVDSVGKLLQQYGSNAGNLLGHVSGEVSGRELSQILQADKKEQMETNLEMLLKLYKEGIIDETNINRMLINVLPGGDMAVLGQIETKQENSGQNTEYEDTEPGAFRWKDS